MSDAPSSTVESSMVTAAGAERLAARDSHMPPRLLDLPRDVLDVIITRLAQKDQAMLLCTCRALYAAVFPHIYRMLRCACCGKELFPPSELAPPPRLRPPHVFLPLHPRTPAALPALADLDVSPSESGAGAPPEASATAAAATAAPDSVELTELGLTVDARRGAANFHVLAHLARTMFVAVRFPLPHEAALVRALRCAGCGVFVGFRKDVPREPPADFVHTGFVDLCDARGRPRALEGAVLPDPAPHVGCAGCGRALFERADMMPWAHVLASTQLRDIDAFLEWEHSWAGGNNPDDPAFFVRRLVKGSFTVTNVRVERLRQGLMEVGDVRCADCRKHVGWKFLAEVDAGHGGVLQNYDQVGRFGVMRSAINPSDPRAVGV